ncbi:MAG: hypothetical protein HY851_05195, partial [candidate division Zixibacteria bacterium]|nr:hypothetical protein [candidate division Zixibacteria bacterium]
MKSLLSALAVATLCAVAAEAKDTTTFRVDSYIPERFTDFQWLADGRLAVAGTDRSVEADPASPYIPIDAGSNSVDRSARLSSFMKYTYYTVPEYLSISMGATGNFAYQRYWNRRFLPPNSGSVRETRYSTNNFTGSVLPAVEYAKYLTGDMFLSLVGEGELRRQENSAHNSTTSWTTINDSVSWYTSDVSQRTVHTGVHVAGAFLGGWGRLYSGSYATTALQLVNELRKSGLLLREPTMTEYQRLCDTIYEFR